MIKPNTNNNALITVWLLSLIICLPVNAEISWPAEPLHWDDAPNWEHSQGNVSKTYIQHSDWHAVTLPPNSAVTYRIPRHAFTRLVSNDKQVPNSITLLRGDGNGLFSPIEHFNRIDKSLLLMPERHYWQLLIHNTGDKAATLSVMTSRTTGQKDIPLARKLISPKEGQTGWLTTPHLSQRDKFAYTHGNSAISYSIEGPLFIEVESLLLETPEEEALPSYLISTQLDGQPWQQWQHQAARYPFVRRSSDLPTIDQNETKPHQNRDTSFKRSTYAEKYYLQIPKGQHTLTFNAFRPIALRLFEDTSWGLSGNEGFLYPNLKDHQQQQLTYQQRLNRLNNDLLSQPPSNASQLLSQWKDQQPLLTSIQERAVNRLLFYRPLTATTVSEPSTSLSNSAQSTLSTLSTQSTHSSPSTLSTSALKVVNLKPVVAKYNSIQGHPALLDSDIDVSKTAFTELKAHQQAIFSLPPLSSPSTLRVRLANLSHHNAKFLITDQNGSTSTLFYLPEFKSKMLEWATQQLKEGEVSAAEAFIPLTTNTTSLSIQSLADTNHSVQLAYLTAKKPSLAPAELFPTLKQLGTQHRADMIAYLQGRYYEPVSDVSAQARHHQLQLSLGKLAHRIKVRSSQFEQTTPSLDPSLLSNSVIPDQWQTTVQKLVERESWANAIDIVSPLALHQDLNTRTSAATVLSDLLLQSGEFHLHEQWLLKILKSPLYQANTRYAEQALIGRYQQQNRMGALEKLSAYRFNQTANSHYLMLMRQSLSNESSVPLRQTIEATYAALKTEQVEANSPTRLSRSASLALTESADHSALWQTLQADELSSASSVLLYGQALETYSYRLTANSTEPLTFTVTGPTRLAIRYRSLLNNEHYKSENSWLTLIDNQQAHYIPTFSSSVSDEVSLIGSDRKVSIEQRFEYQVSEGTHTIQLRPERGDMAIGLSTRSGAVSRTNQAVVNDPKNPMSLSDKDILTALNINNHNETAATNNTNAANSITKTLLRLIWAIEHPNDTEMIHQNEKADHHTLSLIAKGNQLINQQASSPLLNRLSLRLNKNTAWQLEQQLVDSAGKRYVRFNQAPVSNPKTHIRRSLSGQQDASSQWLSAFNDFNFNINSNTPVDLKLALKQLFPTNAFTNGATVQLWLNQQPYRTIELTPNNRFKRLVVNLTPGNHQLRLTMVNAKSDQHVLFKASRRTSNSQWTAIQYPVRQAYSVSSNDHPVKVFAAASQWLRIDEVENGQIRRHYHFQEETGILTLPPKAAQSERLLRVYTLRSRSNAVELPISSPPKHQRPPAPLLYTPIDRQWAVEDHLELGEENEGTWGGYLKYTNRASIDDADSADEGIASSLNAFQVGHLYRIKLNDDRYWTTPSGDWHSDAYWKSDTFLRHTQDSGNTLGSEQRYMLADPLTDWRISLRAKAQYFQASNSTTDDVLNVYTDAQYRHDWQFNRQQSVYASITGFVRYLDNESPNGSNYIDPLVWSDYQRDHRYGWRLAGLWRYRLWQDSRLNIGARVLSNEQLSTLDQTSVQAGYQQYYKGLTAALVFRHIERFSDDDRKTSSQQDEIKGSLRFHRWNASGQEWYGALNLAHDITAGDNSLALTVGFNHSDGRGVRDYLPTVLPMRGLYQQQSTQQQNMNSLSGQPSL